MGAKRLHNKLLKAEDKLNEAISTLHDVATECKAIGYPPRSANGLIRRLEAIYRTPGMIQIQKALDQLEWWLRK